MLPDKGNEPLNANNAGELHQFQWIICKKSSSLWLEVEKCFSIRS